MDDKARASQRTSISMTVDLKKYRIRIHKAVLHILGDPQYIKLLVSPYDMEVAIQAVTRAHSGDQVHKIPGKELSSDSSIEIYSHAFISRLCELDSSLLSGRSYRIDGHEIPELHLAVFSLKTIREVQMVERL